MRLLTSTTIASIGALAVTACATATEAELSASAPKLDYIYYDCRADFRNHERLPGALHLRERRREDGALLVKEVRYDHHVGGRDGPTSLALAWPGKSHGSYYKPDGREFDWSKGTLVVSHYSNPESRFGEKAREEFPWRQIVVSRERDNILDRGEGSERHIFPSPFDVHLMSDIRPVFWPANLSVSIETILAFAGDLNQVKVYETMRKGDVEALTGNYRHVAAAYDLDISMIRALVREIKIREAAWAVSIEDYKSVCQRGEKFEGDDVIVVTSEEDDLSR